MGVQSQIDRIQENVASTYSVLEQAGADMPQSRNTDNLAETAASIKAVLYGKAQTLTEEQKAQARGNISAVSKNDVAPFVVNITHDGDIFADKTVTEILSAYNDGRYVYGVMNNMIYSLMGVTEDVAIFIINYGTTVGMYMVFPDNSVQYQDYGLVTEESLSEIISSALDEAKASGDFDGKTPVRGVDYWTEADQETIANEVTNRVSEPIRNIENKLFEEVTVTHEVPGANILPENMQWVEGYSIKNWSAGSTTMNDLNPTSGIYVSEIIEVEPGVEYVMVKSTGGSSGRSAFGIYDADGVSIKYLKASDGNTFPIPENGKYIRFACNSSQKDVLVSIQPVDKPGQDWVAKVASRTEIVTETVTVDRISQIEQSTTKRSRFIVFSDIHYNENSSSVSASDERMQLLVDSINAEHAKRTVDFCIFNGDIAIGYVKSSVEAFATKWADKFKMPVFWFPGDHDDVNDANWAKIFGNHRQASLEDQNFYFIWMDVYSDANDDGAESSGVRTSSVIDTAWVEQEIAKAGNKPVILMTHYVYADTWYPDISNLLNRYPQIKAVISSHSHNNSVGTIGDNNAAFIETGNFSYPNGADWTKKGSNNEHLWGFANFEIEDGGLYHWYIQPAYNYTNVSVNMPYTEGKKSLIYAMPNVKKGADINLTRHRK